MKIVIHARNRIRVFQRAVSLPSLLDNVIKDGSDVLENVTSVSSDEAPT